jgi:hypothetical protein
MNKAQELTRLSQNETVYGFNPDAKGKYELLYSGYTWSQLEKARKYIHKMPMDKLLDMANREVKSIGVMGGKPYTDKSSRHDIAQFLLDISSDFISDSAKKIMGMIGEKPLPKSKWVDLGSDWSSKVKL